MKKLLSVLVIFTLFAFLVACNDGGKESTDSSNDGTNDSGTNEVATSEEEVTITIASWTLGTEQEKNLDRLMIEAFEDKYPHITVEIDESIDPADWNGSLSSAASAGAMPDVFMLAQIPTGLANDWLLDLNEITGSDEDFANVPEAVRDSVTYNDVVRAIPVAQHFLGYFVNKDLFEQANLNAPSIGMSLDEFSSAIRDVTSINEGVAGLNHPYTITDWYPAAANEDLGWFTYDNGEFQLDSNEFIAGVNFAGNILSNGYAYETLSEEQKGNFNGENPEEVWLNGGIAIKWDGSWITGHIDEMVDFEWDYIGIPGERTVITNDYLGISNSTEHPEAAYLLAKWLSFGEEGFLTRMEIADAEDGVSLSTLPVTTNQAVLDVFFEKISAPGLAAAYENIDNAIIEPVKTVPGFAQSRWEAPTGISIGEDPNVNIAGLIDASVRGDINIEDYASQLSQLANEKYQEGLNAINR